MDTEIEDFVLARSYDTATVFRVFLEQLTMKLVSSNVLANQDIAEILDVCDAHIMALESGGHEGEGTLVTAAIHGQVFGELSSSLREKLELPNKNCELSHAPNGGTHLQHQEWP